MPEPGIEQLSEEQRKKIQDWFDKKTPLVGACSICNHRNWVLADYMAYAPVFSADSSRLPSDSVYPFILLHCQHCSHTIFFSATIMEIAPEQAPERADG